MTAFAPRTANTAPGPIEWSRGKVVVRNEGIFGPGRDRDCERFLGRVLRVEGVCSVSIDRSRGTAVISHDDGPGGSHGFLERLSAVLRNDRPPEAIPPLPRGVRETTCTLYRHGPLLSTFEIVSDRRGRLRLRHEELRRDHTLARQLEAVLNTVPGVRRAAFGAWSRSLMIRYDPAVLSTSRVVGIVEAALEASGGWSRSLPAPAPTRLAVQNMNLGLAALADFAIPALMPVSAVILIGSNLRTFRAAWLQVERRRSGLPVLYTIIVMATLASGQFLASALMSWFFRFWQGRLRTELAWERRRLLDECLPLPRLCRQLTAAGGEVLVPVDRLRPGDRIVIGPGEAIPADGRILDGAGIVDERSVRGLSGVSRKHAGDTLLAGSRILAGSFRLEVAALPQRSRAVSIGRSLIAASSPAVGPLTPTLRAEVFAERTVGPTLATAGFGFLIGDLTAAGAILRPDYATGPALAFPLEGLRDAVRCARSGIVVRTHDAFERLAEVNLIVLDDDLDLGRVEFEVAEIRTRASESEVLRLAASAFRHLDDDRGPALERACRERRVHLLDLAPVGFEPGVTVAHGPHQIRVREHPLADDGLHPLLVEVDGKAVGLISFARSARLAAAAPIGRLREHGPVTIALASSRSEAEVAARAVLLGVDLHVSRCRPEDTASLLRACQGRGFRTAFIGRCRSRAEAAAEAHIAISVAEDGDLDADPAAAILLQPRLDPFAALWDVAHLHEHRLRSLQRSIVVPNVLCVAGAFFFGATALTAVMVSNLGTFGLYSSAVGGLQQVGSTTSNRSRLPR